MQTKKKIDARNCAREQTSPIFTRHQKKMTVITDKKVTELITSSARKQKSDVLLSKKSKDAEAAKVMNTRHEVSLDKSANEIADQCVMDTIFSPAFHLTKDFCDSMPDHELTEILDNKGEINNENHAVRDLNDGNFSCHVTMKREQQYSRRDVTEHIRPPADSSFLLEKSDVHNICEDLPNNETSVNPPCHEQYKITGNLSSEVSAIFLAMQNSKLECIDEPTEDMDADEGDDFDDFDPYLFIKNLPDLSAVVPTFRPMLLPKQTRSCPSTTLVLDLDETLVHSSLEPCEDADFTFPVNFNLKEHTVYVRCRPYLKDFMERVADLFEIIIFTASQSIYAEQLLNVLDPKRKLFRHRVFRESCVFVDGNYLKDLSVLGRDLARVIIIDNSPQAFGFQVDNGIPIESWFEDRSDQALLSLLPFLESLVGVDDVRPMIAKKFSLRDKIAAAAYPSLVFRK